ncbi:MFS transporter [Vibrio sp. HA2012]|uniref:MFS transporter n=1 Tax=Vibrio sp. HA2012 TaxID=1971595 RepID=UPI000C2BD180|nr:MFS transporter [Vibrio sp. HA2012]PJC86652.1 MFS transporter [Vibrio sp. HA2012]
MSAGLKYILAILCCLILANLYYAQPIISDIASDVGIATSDSGIIVTVTQIGYCLGVLFLVPLGDAVESRRLIGSLILGVFAALLSAAVSHSEISFLVSMFFIGLFSCAVQIIIPISVGMAAEKERGQVVGLIISGALLGIVISRPLASFITGFGHWRLTYFFAAGLMVLVGLLVRKLPRKTPTATGLSYPKMLLSMIKLFALPGIKKRLGAMALVFTSFTMFWAAVPIALKDILHFSHSEVALFSLVSLVAPPCAIMAGRVIDKGRGFGLTVLSISMVGCAFIVTPIWGAYVLTFVLAALLFDPGVHMTNVVIQQSVISLVPEARSRLNALCIACTFTGGATGSWLGPWLYSHYGWLTTVLAGASMVFIALILHLSLRFTVGKHITATETS